MWVTAYDVRGQGSFDNVTAAFTLLAVGAWLMSFSFVVPVLRRRFWPDDMTLAGFALGTFLAWMALVISTLVIIATGPMNFVQLVHDVAPLSADAAVVEGRVETFIPDQDGADERHQPESFDVAHEHFAYSSWDETGNFNETAEHGGPIRPGTMVRITHIPPIKGIRF